jgi:hypothetical protein
MKMAFGILPFCVLLFISQSSAAGLKPDLKWDHWYTVKVNGKVPFAYYHEKTQTVSGRTHLELEIFKKEEGFLNQENLGLFAQNDEAVTPLFYNYRMTFKNSETILDGTLDSAQYLNIKIRKNGSELPVVKKHLPANVIFSYMFPIWVAKRLPTLTPNHYVGFQAINEEQIEQQFPIVSGKLMLEPEDAFAKSHKAKKVSMIYEDMPSVWWLAKDGSAIRIVRGENQLVIDQVSKEQAHKFLK